MKYNTIRSMDISNGPGIRVSIFFQGCNLRCPNCFNSDLWDFNKGKEFTKEIKNKIFLELNKPYISGISILGGEPLLQPIEELTKFVKEIKQLFPNKSIWLWTGFTFESKQHLKDLWKYIDVIIDGPFIKQLKDINLKYRGSSNQRIIDVQQTIKFNKICMIADN